MLKLKMGWVTESGKGIGLLWDVLDSLGRPAFLIDGDRRIIDCNDTVTDRLFYSKVEIINEPLRKVVELPRAGNGALFDKKHTSHEGRYIRKDRESFPADITIIKQTGFSVVIIEDIGDIDNVRTRAAHRSRELGMYNALSETLSKHLDLEEMITNVLETLVQGMRIDAAWLYIIDDQSGKLSLWNYRGVDERIFTAARSLEPYECFIGKVLSSEKALLVKNAPEDPRVTHIDIVEPGFHSLAGIPLTVTTVAEQKVKVVGVLGVASKAPNRFTSLDMQFLGTVGNQLGVAIENSRLIASLRDKMRQIELINEISSVVNSSLSIGHIFRLVVSEIKKTIHFDRASINLLDEDRNVLKIFALDTKRRTRLTKGVTAPIEGTSAGWVATRQRPWINYDLQNDTPFELDSLLMNEGIRSTISIPLFKDRPLGALNFDSLQPDAYADKDLEILLPVAKHLSIALENALLFEEISKEKREWERTFDAITDMVWIEDRKGRVLRVNKAIIEKSGRPELALVHKSSTDMFKALRIRYVKDPATGHPEGKRAFYKELTGLEGSAYHFWTYPLVDSDGKTYGVVNYLRDVTEQKHLEQQLLRSEKLASLGTLVAGIAHEINNPLGIIAGYAEALMDRAKEPGLAKLKEFEDFPEYLSTINSEIFRCKNILKTLLDFARPSTGTLREIDINELIKEVILLVEHSAKKQQHIIALNLNRDVPKLIAEPGALRQLFINIIMNSLYFMDTEGRIVISTSHITGHDGKGYILIDLADNGKGIDKSMIDKIFDPFFTSKPVGEGTGLGLSICHRIVSEHKGTIDVENNKQGGTTFHIKLPVRDRQRG
jgi:two-component system NtrC family sensor kinase